MKLGPAVIGCAAVLSLAACEQRAAPPRPKEDRASTYDRSVSNGLTPTNRLNTLGRTDPTSDRAQVAPAGTIGSSSVDENVSGTIGAGSRDAGAKYRDAGSPLNDRPI